MSASPSLTGPVPRGPERRQYTRCRVLEKQLVTVDLGSERRALLVDISEGGAAIQPYAPLYLGDASTVKFHLPPDRRLFEAEGIVTWVGPSGRAGIKFINIGQQSQLPLNEWVKQLHAPASPAPQAQHSTAAFLPPSYSPWIRMSDVRVDASALPDDISSLDLVSALRLVVERARSLTGATGAVIALADGGDMVCRARTGAAPDLGARFRPDTGLSGEAVRKGAVALCLDAESDSRVDQDVCRRLNVRSIAIVPVLSGKAVIGVVEAFASQPNAFEQKDILNLRRLADFAGAMLEHGNELAASSSRPPLESWDIGVPRDHAAQVAGGPFKPSVGLSGAVCTPPPAAENNVQPVSPAEINQIYNRFTEQAKQEDRTVRNRRMLSAVIVLALGAGLFGAYVWSGSHGAKQVPPMLSRQTAPPAVTTQVALPEVSAQTELSRPIATPSKKKAKPNRNRDIVAENWVWTAPEIAGTGSEMTRMPESDSAQQAPKLTVGQSSPAALNAMLTSTASQPELVKPAPEQSAQVHEGRLITRVNPMLPPVAAASGLHGSVVIKLAIDKTGKVSRAQLVNGNAVLGAAAVNALRRWRYEPFTVNGKAVWVEKLVTIDFANERN